MAEKKAHRHIAENLRNAKTQEQLGDLERRLLATRTLLGFRFEELSTLPSSPEKKALAKEFATYEKKVKIAQRVVESRLKRIYGRKTPAITALLPKRLPKRPRK